MTKFEKLFQENEEFFYEIYASIRENDINKLDDLLSKYPDFIHVPVYGDEKKNESLLHFAAFIEQRDICLYLIKSGIDINFVDGLYHTPLKFFASHGELECIKDFILRGAWVDGDCRGIITPLISAVIEGHIEIVKYLLDCGADINRLHRRFNQTPLDLAKVYGHQDIIELLESRGGLSAQEQIDLMNERGDGILAHIDNNVGLILSTVLNKDTIDIRTALIEKDKKFKLLFTIGVFETSPRIELMMSVPYDWPINLQLVEEKCVESFPIQLMFLLGQYKLDGNKLQEGIVIEKTDTNWNKLEWPESIDAFILTDFQFNPYSEWTEDVEEDDDEVSLLLLIPIKYPKTGCPKGIKLENWLNKHRSAKWGKVSLKV
ncbi:ankyrin repeat domain-containing protein [Lysinibacillus sp. NPDC097162]|uniref:ankyrin repeat domain-containing protein n=1 Tax=Lysinibacillus sp. NPDC097162 TaxID=3364140 RepID=UPI0037F15CC7